MNKIVVTPQNKGQITIPKKWRDELQADAYQIEFDGYKIVVLPMYTNPNPRVLAHTKAFVKKHQQLFDSLAK